MTTQQLRGIPIPLRPDRLALVHEQRRSLTRAIAAMALGDRVRPASEILKSAWPNDADAGLILRAAVSPTTTAGFPADLDDMFGRRQKPKLELHIKIRHATEDDPSEDLTFRLKNSGRAIAKHSGFWVRLDNAEIKTVDGLENISVINDGRPTVSFEHSIGVIHPSGISLTAGQAQIRRINPTENLGLRVHLYCENMRPSEYKLEIAPLQTGSESSAQEG